MSTPNRVDTSTLGWVKDEIDQTLGQAREALQRYIEADDDVTPLRLFANNVHQVAGTLQMVELDGAAQLAQETESLAAALVSGKIENDESRAASGLLGDSLDHLSHYMERLARGVPDRPIDNVEVINALRGARRAEALDPYSLFYPDLDVYPTRDQAPQELDEDSYAERARELRRTYQASLLNWLRGKDEEQAWQGMSDAVAELYGLSRFQASMQIWWVARAYLDVLKEAELARDDPRKHPLAQLDQLMRKLAEDGEAAIAREGSDKLLRFMLYHIGRGDVRTDATRAVVQLFDLDRLLGTPPEEETPVPDESALDALRGDQLEALRTVQTTLDEFSRAGRADEAFEEAGQRLTGLAEAAREAGVPELAELAGTVRDLVFAGDDGAGDNRSEDVLLAAAQALLFIERTLEHPTDMGADWRDEAHAELERLSAIAARTGQPSMAIESREVDASALDARELRRLVRAVGGQVEENLKLAEENLERYSKDARDIDSLGAVVDSLQQVHGAVRMLGQHGLCELLELAMQQLRAVIGGEIFASDELLDALAVTIGTTDAYVKGMERDAPNIDTLLERALQELEDAAAAESSADVEPAAALANIQSAFDLWIRDNADYASFRILRRNLRDLGALAHERGELSLQRIAQEMTNLVDIVMDDPSFLSQEVEDTLRRSLAILTERAAPLQQQFEAQSSSPDASAAPEAVEQAPEEFAPADEAGGEDDGEDDMVREIFAEEAGECLQAIESGLGTLADNPDDPDTLTEVRRSFHTIKGSGRMAKARDIAELAWVVEDTLNRCLDGSIPVSKAVVEFVSQARSELSRMLDEGLDSSADLQFWRGRAAALHSGEDVLPEPEPVSIEIEPASAGRPGLRSVNDPDGGPADEEESVAEEVADAAIPWPDHDDGEPGDESALTSIEDLGDQGHDLAGERAGPEQASPFSDGEVIRIFSREALSHIAAIRAVIDECRRQGSSRIGDALLRAVHTLQGNARSLHLVEMSEAYSALDTALNAKATRGVRIDRSETGLLEELLVSTAKVLDHLNRDKRFPEVVRQELVELAGRITRSLGGDQPAERSRLEGLELVSDFVSGDRRAADEQPSAGESVFENLGESQPMPTTDPDAGIAAGESEPPKTMPESMQPAEGGETSAQEAADSDEPGLDADLKDVFAEEAADILARLESTLQQGRRSGMDTEIGTMLKRELHTLKGSARAAGMQAIGDLSHDAETMLDDVTGRDQPPADLLEVLEEVHDSLASMIQGLESGVESTPDPALVQRLRGGGNQAALEREPDGESAAGGMVAALKPEEGTNGPEQGAPGTQTSEPRQEEHRLQPESEQSRAADEKAAPPGDASRAAGGRSMVRIRSNVLDKLVNYAGEVSISRAQLEEQLSGLKGNLNELRANVARFADQVRELDIQADTQIRSRVAEETVSGPGHDFDPLEMDRYSRLQQLSRSLSESVDDLVTIQTGLNRFAVQTEGVLSQQAMLNSELQDGLMSARMVPFNTLVPRLRHQVRQTARELGKEVDFVVNGAELEVDRNILDQLNEALEHMIRNSLDHGIEAAQVRAAAGKPARGQLRIDCRQEGNEVLLKFSDDGAGLDVERIKERAVEAGLLGADSDLTDDEVIQLIVLSGFSTARAVTQLSGRGVGLDVVNDAVRRLGGSLTLDNRPGQGVTFALRLPLSLSITQAMFVLCGGQRFAIPLGVIETVLKTDPENLQETSKDGDPLFRHDDRVYTLMDLTAALGLESAPADKRVPILLVRMGAREVAVRVDDLVGTDEIVVKQLGDHLGRMSGINGATVTGDGSVVLILDLAELWLAQERQPALRREAAPETDAPPRVMVVDDSLTVRKVTARNLGRHGMEVSMARDGIDALEQLSQSRPDVMLVDIEMPRMDGYELTSKVREDIGYRDIPIIMITSRAGAKHREKAMELGANAYLTKPYQERELLEQINALLPGAARSPVN
ncbi:MAG TPA: Hpt domain-containing protein [Arenicellales bacterium]|nr:Hpt domain-containing protein [Arenicellales bacterium]